MAVVTYCDNTTKDRIGKSLTSRQAQVLRKLQSCFVIKLTSTFSNEAGIFLVGPIKKRYVIELLAYLEKLNDDLYPHVVLSVEDYAFILRRYYGFRAVPSRYLKYMILSSQVYETNLQDIWNYNVPDLASLADINRLKIKYGNCGIEYALRKYITLLCHCHPWAVV